MRSAKNERPLTTASPESAEEITPSSVDTTRGSKTTVQWVERVFWAPSIRTARSTASSIASLGTRSAGTASDAEAGPGLRLLGLPRDGIDGEEGRCTPPVRRDAGGRGERDFDTTVRVVGRRHLADPGIGGPGGALELDGQGDLVLHGGGGDGGVPQIELGGGDAVGLGQHHVGVGRGEAGVVPGVGQGGPDDVGVEAAGPGEADPGAGGIVDEHTDADARRVGRRERLDLALVGADLGVGAAGDVDLEGLVAVGPADDVGGQVEEFGVGRLRRGHAVPPRVTPVMRRVA